MISSLEDRKPLKGNAVGSRSSIENAYIAGFLDGDGSLMLQVKKRSDTVRGFRFMATICFYQDSRHDKSLYWIQDVLNAGYLAKRNDHITELRINGFATILQILRQLQPYVRFKESQMTSLMSACDLLKRGLHTLSNNDISYLVELVLTIQRENYSAHSKKTREELLKIVGLTP